LTVPLNIAVEANVLVLAHGGIPKYVERIVAELVDGGDHVDLLMNRWRWTSPIPGARPVGLRLKGFGPWRNVAVPAWCAVRRPQVLWAPETTLPAWSPVPTVSTVHDLAPLLFPESKPPSVLKAFTTVIPRSVRSATRVICVSEATARDVREAWSVDADRIRVVPNGVDDRFTPGDRAAAAAIVHRDHGIDGPFVLHVGALEPRKGLDVLIEAASGAVPWKLVLVGSPAFDGERLAAAAAAAGAILLEGVDDDALVPLYRAAEAVAAPAIYEGFGIVPLEAMACGTPAVVAAGAGALEDVSGPAAIVVGERTAAAWAAALAEASARRERYVAAGIEHAARFRWPAVAAATRAVLAEAAYSGAGAGRAPRSTPA
jgi:glycosyltransferase involved in cell wall biosynthesis